MRVKAGVRVKSKEYTKRERATMICKEKRLKREE